MVEVPVARATEAQALFNTLGFILRGNLGLGITIGTATNKLRISVS